MGIVVLSVMLYCAISRNTVYTRYMPLQRTIFRIAPDSHVTVKMQDGSNGAYYELENDGEMERALELLGEFQYRYWLPSLRRIMGMSGWSDRIILESGEGRQAYYCGEDWIEVGGIIYYGDLSALFELYTK